MTVKDFIEEYNNTDKKENFIKKHIINKYIDYERKIGICRGIVNATMFIDMNGKKIWHRDMPAYFRLYTLIIINEYTDIDIDYTDLKEFNLLEENGLTDIIKAYISEREITSFETILNMCYDDTYENERSLGSYLESIKIALDNFKNLPLEEILEEINKQGE